MHNLPKEYADITFYDANHCPGACIILIELSDGKTTHLHTGDMRYCSTKFQSYPLLTKSIKERKLDLIYLDTTYCHPKHDFITQNEAVDSIASQTEELLSRKSSDKTLVLLSCYSIGKEKVLYEASRRSKQQIYVSEKKWRMLQCIQQKISGNNNELSTVVHEQHSNILERCTRDPSSSDLHVIPMGLAGEMFPYFQPEFQKIAKYVENLSSLESKSTRMAESESTKGLKTSHGEYDKVVAFIPTGWANSSNWNKKNAISTKKVELSSSKTLHVEVRLISYSEHSTYPELVSFVQYLKPRKIVPTVYSDENHKRKIEGRFRNLLDSTRAKRAFFRSMTKKSTTSPITAIVANERNCKPSAAIGFESISKLSDSNQKGKPATGLTPVDVKARVVAEFGRPTMFSKNSEEEEEVCDDIEIVGVIQPVSSKCASSSQDPMGNKQELYNDEINLISSMGFDKQQAKVVLEKCNGNLQDTMDYILSSGTQTRNAGNNLNQHRKQGIESKIQSHSLAGVKKRKISDFFIHKK
eukprot:jgi/Psemu1/307645/fgenesh1_kg.344_\